MGPVGGRVSGGAVAGRLAVRSERGEGGVVVHNKVAPDFYFVSVLNRLVISWGLWSNGNEGLRIKASSKSGLELGGLGPK